MSEAVLVSACLLAHCCRYDGRHCGDELLWDELEQSGVEPLAFCPEQAGGLPTPRPAASYVSVTDDPDSILIRTEEGQDVTAAFQAGAQAARSFCAQFGIRRAYLKEDSPSCGVHYTYVDGRKVEGRGLTARLLAEAGIELHAVAGRRRR